MADFSVGQLKGGEEEMRGYHEEIGELGSLTPVTLALVEYAKALVPGGEFVRKGRLWVSRPNFVAFGVHWARSRHVTFILYGTPKHFEPC